LFIVEDNPSNSAFARLHPRVALQLLPRLAFILGIQLPNPLRHDETLYTKKNNNNKQETYNHTEKEETREKRFEGFDSKKKDNDFIVDDEIENV
jgi:hypothetical protein